MPTLVIGGTGFIGPRLIKRLLAAGETVVCMDVNLGTGPFTSLSDKVRVIRGDVTHFEDVMRAVLEVKPDRLINLAYGTGRARAIRIRSSGSMSSEWTTASRRRAWVASSVSYMRARSR